MMNLLREHYYQYRHSHIQLQKSYCLLKRNMINKNKGAQPNET